MSFRYYQPPKVTPKQESDESSDSESDSGRRRRSRKETSANKAALNKRYGLDVSLPVYGAHTDVLEGLAHVCTAKV